VSDRDILEAMQKSGSQLRYRPVGNGQAQADVATLTRKPVQRTNRTSGQPLVRRTIDYADAEPTTNVPRRTQEQPQSRRTTSAYQQQQRRTIDTNTDVEVAPSVRRLRDEKVQPTRKLPPQNTQGHGKALAFGVGLTILALWLAWVATTAGASLWVTHVTDPGTYGPTHGNMVSGVFGGGDSQEHPTKLIAFNNDGHVEILKLTAGNPQKTQLIAGPNLVALDFPDPLNAVVELQVDTHNTVTVTVYSSTFVFPFTRYSSQPLVFLNDGKGNLKLQTGGQ